VPRHPWVVAGGAATARLLVRRAVEATQPALVLHGHWHQWRSVDLTFDAPASSERRWAQVEGLARTWRATGGAGAYRAVWHINVSYSPVPFTMAKQPPFHFGSPATGVYFAGRQAEVGLVLRRMSDHINVVVSSPRRYGKTSVLLKAAAELEAKRGAVARIRVNEVTSTSELTAALLTELSRLEGTARRFLDFVGRLRVRPTMAVDASGRATFSFEPVVSDDVARATLTEVVDGFGELARRRTVAVVLDEFQAVVDLDRALPRAFKGLSDAHPELSFVFCGSDHHLMTETFIDRGAPLLGMAEVLVLEPLPTTVMVPFLIDRSAASGIEMTEAAARRLFDLAGPAPNDIQHLAYEAVPLADPGIDETVVDAALVELISHRAVDYAATFEALTVTQKRLIRLLARGPRERLQAAEVTREVGAAGPSGIRRALGSLASRKRPLVTQEGGLWRVDDPFFGAWLRQVDRSPGRAADVDAGDVASMSSRHGARRRPSGA